MLEDVKFVVVFIDILACYEHISFKIIKSLSMLSWVLNELINYW